MRLTWLALPAAALAAAGAAALAPAQAPPPDRAAHLLVVPATAEGTAALAATDARTVARYEAFTLVEAAGADDERLRDAGAGRRDDMRTVETAAGAVDPAADRASLAAKDAPEPERALALVQFVGPPKDAWLERLRATGAELVTYQAENAYVVHARGEAVDRLAALAGSDPAVRAVSVLTAADKLEDRASPSGVFAVTTVAGAAGERARAAAGKAAGTPLTVGELRTDFLPLSGDEAARLAADPGVVALEAYTPPRLLDERSAQIVAGNLTAPALTQPSEPPAYRDWLLAKGFTGDTFDFAIDVTDSGLDAGTDPPAHPDFRRGGSATDADRVAYLANYTADADVRDCGGHGTNVASIAAGHGRPGGGTEFEDNRGFDHGLGVAPFARVGASKLFDCTNATAPSVVPGLLTETAYAGGARISNNSWGSDGNSYTVLAAAYDQLVRDASRDAGHQPLVEVFAAGNDGRLGYGTIANEPTAKNVITVGAAEGVRPSGTNGCNHTDAAADSARDIPDFSSRGPTADGRLKPDLVAPGTHIVGASPQHAGYTGTGVCTKAFAGTTWYSVAGGTSQAAPHVAGAAALVRDWSQRTRGSAPSPALTKALLVNTATDLGGGQNGKGDTIAPGPNHDQGWGRVNVGTVLDGTRRDLRDQVPADRLGASGERRIRGYAVHDPEQPVKVTLAWTDAPGTSTGNPVVNDLDLVVDAGGRTYRGNVFAGAISRTGGEADTRNNLESVHLPPGTNGRFAVRVVGTTVAGDGLPGNLDPTDQDYALVVSNAEASPAAVLSHDLTTLDTSIAAGGDGDGALEPGESFALDERVTNAGDATATEVSGTLTGGALAMTRGTSRWLDLASGTSRGSVTGFAGTLAGDASCGADAEATLSLTTAAGTHTVPLVLPTGVPSAPAAVTRTHSAPRLAIPDDDAKGITSTLELPAAGRLKDVDVRIADLDHPWAGDLRIELVAPDGTVVTLVDQPGGPQNQNDDLTGTVFDDEASGRIQGGAPPYSGRFRPQNDQLARLDGKQQQGVWTLRVRDLGDGETGTLGAWGLETSVATCSVAAVTRIDSGPAEGAVTGPAPTFSFGSDLAGASFECRLDGATFAPCTAPKSYGGLSDGTHSFEVRAVVGGQTDPTPASRGWTVDATPPATTFTGGLSGRVGNSAAEFRFGAPGATFECRLDGAPFAACTSPHEFGWVAEGEHTFQVRARDVHGNVEEPPASRTWTVDTAAPAPVVSTPVDGATIRGTAGTAAGDAQTVKVTVSAGGTAVRTQAATRDAAGAWAVAITPALPAGDYTARVEQADEAVPANVGRSAEVAFTVVAPASPGAPAPPASPVVTAPQPIVVPHQPLPAAEAPSFVLAPAEVRPGDRLTVLAACASACTVKADLGRLGRGSAALPAAGTAVAKVRLKPAARRASRAVLRVTVTEGGRTLTLRRPVAIRRTAGLRRIAASGLRLWAVCSEPCPISATLTASGRSLGGGSTVAQAGSPARLVLRVTAAEKRKLKRARRVTAVLEAVAGSGPTRVADLGVTLRR